MAIKYVPYFPNTLEGQAILDNFVRTKRVLRYRDNDQVIDRIQRGMPLYEMELKEQIGKNPNHNMIIRGECLSACAYLRDKGIFVDLIYVDPPFASGADYAKKVYIRRNPKVAAAIAQAESELDIEELKAFEEKMYGDVWDKERYLNWMYENLMAMKSIMSDIASIYVHLDYRMCHYVKVLMDEIFGEENYGAEITWKKTTKTTNFNTFGSEHDTILYYYKQYDSYIFNQSYTDLKESEIITKYVYLERPNGEIIKLTKEQREGTAPLPEGRRFRGVPLLNMNQKRENLRYDFLGYNHVWSSKKEKLEDLYKKGKIFQIDGGCPMKKGFLDENQGAKVNDIWTDISAVNSQAKERVDYVHQKPEALLERIINTSSNKGAIVADFFGGSGVTAAVANKLGRNFIHCDIGINSIQTVRDRLLADKAEFEVLEIKDGVSLYRNPIQTMDKLKSLIQGLRNEDALDKFWEGSIVDTKYGMMPVYLPNLMDSSTRLLDKVLMNRIIREALPDLPADTQRVIVYYIDITDKQEIEQFIKEENNQTTIEIELRDLKQVLDEVVVEDEAEWEVSETHDGLWTGWKVEIKSFHSDRVLRKIEEVNLKAQQQVLQQKAKGKEKEFKPIVISDEGLETIEWISLDCTNADKQAPWKSDTEIKIDRLGYVIRNGVKTQDFWNATIQCDNKPLRMKIRNICGDETVYTID